MRNDTTKLYIFDVDGTLRWTRTPGQHYPLRDDDWEIFPNVAETLQTIPWSDAGPWLVIASNQPGVGEGLLDEDIARRMIADTVRSALGYLPHRLVIEMCVCDDTGHCYRKKPNPGMLAALLEKFSVSPSEALFVGDQPIDAEAAKRAGIPFAWAGDFFKPRGRSRHI